jgi:predicted MFS family arabinose efflux permease
MSAVSEVIAVPAPLASEQDSVVARTRRKVLILTLLLVVGAAAVLSYRTDILFEAELGPEVLGKSQTMADFLAADVKLAISYGIPLTRLVGVSEYFDQKRAAHPEIKFIALLGADGRPLYVGGTYLEGEERAAAETAAHQLVTGTGATAGAIDPHALYVVMRPVRTEAGAVAAVAIGTDPDLVNHQLQELAYDVGIILLVSLFLAFEIAVALLAISAVAPMNQLLTLMRAAAAGDFHRRIAYRTNNDIGRAIGQYNRVVEGLNNHYGRLAARLAGDGTSELKSRLIAIGERFGLTASGTIATRAAAAPVDVRLPLFVFILAEEMQKPFLPLYVRSLQGNVAWLSQEVLIGLPISIYMLTLALATPFAGSWADRTGARRIFVLGLVPALAGFLGSAFAATVLELMAARAVTAIGYAMCTIAAQGFIIQVTPAKERAQGMSVFVGVLMSANICGTAIGGILADRLGFRAVFVFAGALALLAGMLALRMLPPMNTAAVVSRSPRLADFRVMFASWRFVGLIVFASVPAKIILTGFLFYAVPLYLGRLGVSPAETGRIMMLYSLVIVFAGPWLSRFSDRNGYGRWMVFAGTLFAGLAMTILWWRSDDLGVVAAVLVVALAHAASISPQIALLPEICRREIERVGETTVLSILRMVERIGSVIGPILVAALVTEFGFVEGLTLVGAYLVVLSFLLLTTYAGLPRRTGD